jgi:hypothetical protein
MLCSPYARSRVTVSSVRGRLLLQSRTAPRVFVAIARWASVEDWWTLRRGEKSALGSFRTAAVVSRLQVVEPLCEVRDLRVLIASETGGQTAALPARVVRSHEKRDEPF